MLNTWLTDDVTSVVVTLLLLVVFIGFSIFYLYYKNKNSKSNSKEKTLTKQSQASKDPEDSQEVVSIIIVIVYTQSSSSEDGYPDDYKNDNFIKSVDDPFPDLDRKLGHIVNQVDDRTFQARVCETDSLVVCYLSHDLFHKNTRPLIGGLVRLEYSSDFGLRIPYIVQVIDSEIKERSPWVWNVILAEIIGEYEEMDERIIYVRLEPGQLVPCKVVNYLLNTYMQGGDIVLVEVNETNRSFYTIIEIVIYYDTLGIP